MVHVVSDSDPVKQTEPGCGGIPLIDGYIVNSDTLYVKKKERNGCI